MDEKKKIGIKIADGTFFPVLEGKTDKKKRLVLTTVKDNQTSVQIDLYEGLGDNFENPSYVGTMVIDDIAPAEKGTPEIEMIIGMDDGNVLNATAKDLASGAEESLNVSVESFDGDTTYDVPEFTLEDDAFDFDDSIFDEEEAEVTEETPEETGEDVPEDTFEEAPEDEPFAEPERKKGMNPFLILVLVLAALAILGGVVYLVYNSFADEKVPVLQAMDKTGNAEEASKAVTVKSGGDTAAPASKAESGAAAAVEKTEPAAAAESPPEKTSPAPAAEAEKKTADTAQGVW